MAMTPFADDAFLGRYMSVYGISTFADHDQNGTADTGVLDDCKTYAMGMLVGRLSHRYTYAVLVNAAIIPELFTIIALRELCLRRGNPPPASLEFRYQEIVKKDDGILDMIRSGREVLVDSNGDPLRSRISSVPMHSNLTIDRWYTEKRVRVVSGSSNNYPSAVRRDLDRSIEDQQ